MWIIPNTRNNGTSLVTNTCIMLCVLQQMLYKQLHVITIRTIYGMHWYISHFTDEKTKVPRHELTNDLTGPT